ncbi:MAG: HAMP domain-containing histidine kinase [Anaerolineales bacterium]|nr:MAG: HAMP domain-containing histidine kinase [Anaerolineales bacterium]
MMFPNDITTMLVVQPGNLVYHLILMLSFALVFSAARILQTNRENFPALRWARISIAILAMHFSLVLVGVAAWAQWLDGEVLLPGLERWLSFSTIALLLWGFLAAESDRRELRALWSLLSLAGLGAVSTIYAYALQGGGVAFNSTSFDAAWGVVGLALVGTGLLVLLLRRPSIWSLSFAGFALIAVGYVLHMTLGPTDISFAAYIRWGELMGIPILILAAFRSMLLTPATMESPEVPDADATPPTPIAFPKENDIEHLPQVLLDLRALLTADRLDRLSEMAVRTFARAMKAELCILLTPPTDSGQLSIAAGYDLISERFLDGRTLSSEDIPVIIQAMERKRSVDLPAQSQAPDILGLQKALFLARTGPILFSPILDRTELLGGIALLSPFARTRWPLTSQRALEKLAEFFTERVQAIQAQEVREIIPDRYYNSEIDTTRREVERLVLDNSRLTEQLIVATDQASHDLAGFLENHTLASETIQILDDEISRMRTAINENEQGGGYDQTDDLTTRLQDTLQELAGARARLVQIEGEAPEREPQAPSKSAVKAIANLARDLRQPMSTILGYTELLNTESSGLLTAEQTQYINHIHGSTERLTRHLNSLIHIMEIHTGTLDLVPTSINIQGPLRDALGQASNAIRKRRQTVRVDLPKPVPKVLGDADALFQMLVHLLNNAVGATSHGGKIWIAAKVAETDSFGFLTLWITDGGEGIPADDRRRIFDVEYPRSGKPIRGIGDDGIGLSIAKSLVEAMGGRLWVDSQPQQGSTFTILLPLSEQPTQALET